MTATQAMALAAVRSLVDTPRVIDPDLTWVYRDPQITEAHLVHHSTDPVALCGAESSLFTGWFGTGSHVEYDTAARLEPCFECVELGAK
jgi:hypothetical protein